MAKDTRQCPHCLRAFPTAEHAPRCPRCGQPWIAGNQTTASSSSTQFDLSETLPAHGSNETFGPRDDSGDLTKQLLGTTLFLYQIEEFLGRGSMAWVFRSTHTTLQRPCAVKILRQQLRRRQPDSVDMFLREARSAASLIHPNVVTVHNVGEADTHHFIEMEYVPGQPLQSLAAGPNRVPMLDATRYLVQTCSALAAAHAQGLIHRDFKPANILVHENGAAKLADFGLARRTVAAEGRPETGLTGTPFFMAPELFEGGKGSESSDVYAVGISYYYLLTGQFPFRDRNLLKLGKRHAEQPIPDARDIVSSIPEGPIELINRALAKRPEDRFCDGHELYCEMERIFLSLKDLRSLVSEAILGLDAAVDTRDPRISVVVQLPTGRRQTVFIKEETAEPWSTPVVRVYSPCGPAETHYYRRALEINARVPHGSLAIEELDGVPHFVMLHCYPRATCDPVAIHHSIRDIAHWADEVENVLTGQDRF